jgi:hypothetical protein
MMSLASKRCHGHAAWTYWPVMALALLVAACGTADPEMGKRRHEKQDGPKKVPTGMSFAEETRVDAAPAPAAAPGWDIERVASGEDDWEPAVGADPVDEQYVYQAITRYTGPKPCGNCKLPAIMLRRSDDFGATWTDQFLALTSKSQYDPQVEVADNGHVYAVWLDQFTPGSTFTKSTNHGATWSAGKSFAGKGKKPQWNDKPWLVISNDGQHVYLGFNSSDSYIVSSHDGGNTFSLPVKTNNDNRYWFHSGGAVSPTNPNVAYFACSTFSSGQTYAGDAHVEFLKTTDGGATWTTTRIDTSRDVPPCGWAAGCYTGFLGSTMALAVDGAGTIVVVYHVNGTPGVPEQMYFKVSTDQGATWSARQLISDAPTTAHHAFPGVAAHPNANGDFRVTWQDDRMQSQTGWNTWYRRLTNVGQGNISIGPEIRLSDQATGAPYKSAAGYRFPYGDYHEIAVGADGTNYVIWGEGDSYTGPGGAWYTRGQ